MSFEWRTVIILWLLKSIGGEREGESKGGRERIKEEGEREGVRNLGTISICM